MRPYLFKLYGRILKRSCYGDFPIYFFFIKTVLNILSNDLAEARQPGGRY